MTTFCRFILGLFFHYGGNDYEIFIYRKDITQTAYMLYMIIGSYFHRCSCRSKALEENLFLYYKELQEKRQVEKERQIIRVSEGVLKDNMTDLAEMNAEVVISRADDLYILRFYTGFERVVVTVDEKGCYEISLGRDELAV